MNKKTSVSILGNKTSIKRKRQHAKGTNWFVLQTKVNKYRKFMLRSGEPESQGTFTNEN